MKLTPEELDVVTDLCEQMRFHCSARTNADIEALLNRIEEYKRQHTERNKR
jgi:hypothetical protein